MILKGINFEQFKVKETKGPYYSVILASLDGTECHYWLLDGTYDGNDIKCSNKKRGMDENEQ